MVHHRPVGGVLMAVGACGADVVLAGARAWHSGGMPAGPRVWPTTAGLVGMGAWGADGVPAGPEKRLSAGVLAGRGP